MKLVITDEIAKAYPDLRIGVLVARGIDNAGSNADLDELKIRKADEFREKYNPNTLLENPYIAAWRDVYRSFGAKPKETKPTAEALLRRLIHGEEIPNISKAVDLYLVIETEFYLPIGGYDLETINGDIHLRHSPGNEPFIPLGSTKVEETTRPGEVIYADNNQVLTRKWNFRDCDMCKITQASKNIGLFTEAPLASIPTEHLQSSLEKMKNYMIQYCGGEVTTFIVYASQSLNCELP